LQAGAGAKPHRSRPDRRISALLAPRRARSRQAVLRRSAAAASLGGQRSHLRGCDQVNLRSCLVARLEAFRSARPKSRLGREPLSAGTFDWGKPQQHAHACMVRSGSAFVRAPMPLQDRGQVGGCGVDGKRNENSVDSYELVIKLSIDTENEMRRRCFRTPDSRRRQECLVRRGGRAMVAS
jgi:hypothetical protein